MVRLRIGGRAVGATREEPSGGKAIELSEKTLQSERAPGVLAHELYHSSYSPRRGDLELFRQLGLQSLEAVREELEAELFAAAQTGSPPKLGHLRWVWMYAWDAGLTKKDFLEEMEEAAERVGYTGSLPSGGKFKEQPILGRPPMGEW